MADNGNSPDNERRHARANANQAEDLRGAYRRALHRAYIESALSRTRQEVLREGETAPANELETAADE
jgi:hypothetical protein